MTSLLRERLRQNVERDAVVGVVEGGNENQVVRDIRSWRKLAAAQAAKENGRGRGSSMSVNCLPSGVRAALRRARFSASGAWLASLCWARRR